MRTAFLVVFLALMMASCKNGKSDAGKRAPGTRSPTEIRVVESIYDDSLSGSWSSYGWAPRLTSSTKGPAVFDFSKNGGWIVGRPGLRGRFGGLTFRFRAPDEYGDFLEVRVESIGAHVFERIKIGPAHRVDLADGWCEVFVPMVQLNPGNAPFDRVVLRAYRAIGKKGVEFDKIGFTDADNVPSANSTATTVKVDSAKDAGVAQPDLNLKETKMVIDCASKSHRIKPDIFGIAYDFHNDSKNVYQWQMGAAARRWGGNPSSRYNWMLGNAWNTGSDWFFRNVNYAGRSDFSYQSFLEDNLAHRVNTALTLPMIGWVAKDVESYSFPVSIYGPQRSVDPHRPNVGDGTGKDGKPIIPPEPVATSVLAPPSLISRWVTAIREKDRERQMRSVQMYILDNEPCLWNSTHRDVHPDPMTYDELLERTITYGTAVRKADPDAVIAGPALWGWPAYFYSAKDAAAGFDAAPDRRAHANLPLLPWYLQKLREHEQKTGVKVLNTVDVHFYPQGAGLRMGTGGDTDAETNARRIRSTRALWDVSYIDESWIKDTIHLLPRLRKWINEYYPGLGISVGEYNFGAEGHMSGALALAEALGRFAQHDIDSAFYWTYPVKDSPAYWAFRAFRNFDGNGDRFQDLFVSTRAGASTSLFASRNENTSKLVAIALNFDTSRATRASIDLSSCGIVTNRRTFTLSDQSRSLAETKSELDADEERLIHQTLPPYSITVLEIDLAPRNGANRR